jgi:hypothetical protein
VQVTAKKKMMSEQRNAINKKVRKKSTVTAQDRG